MSEEMECEHFIVMDDFGEGSVREWCTNCGHEVIEYD